MGREAVLEVNPVDVAYLLAESDVERILSPGSRLQYAMAALATHHSNT